MSRTTMTAALALMLAAAVPAYAQTSSSSTSPPSTSASSSSGSAPHVTATQLQPGQIRATQMEGSTVYDTQNQKVGDVKDIILDRDGKVAAVVLDVGAFLGIGGKNVAISMNDLKITQDNNSNKPRFTVDMTKDQLKAAQAYDLNGNGRNTSSGSTTSPASRSNNSGSNSGPVTPGTPPKP
ncbi:MAG TPA: PRC-barrel domain-containing protein [Stellaceae bacterium]